MTHRGMYEPLYITRSEPPYYHPKGAEPAKFYCSDMKLVYSSTVPFATMAWHRNELITDMGKKQLRLLLLLHEAEALAYKASASVS